MKKSKVIIQLCIGMCVVIGIGGCARKQGTGRSEEKNTQKIVVGSDNYPPYNYLNTDGEATGIDVDLAKEAFGRMGYEVEFKAINWEEKKELLKEGTIDCIWGSFSMDGREDEYNWAGPYMISRQVVAVRVDSDIWSLQDLEGKKLAVQSTTKPEELFRNYQENHLPHLREMIAVQNRELIYPFLSKGYVDAVAAHETAILQYMKDYRLEYRILEEPLMIVGLGVAFDKADSRKINEKLSKVFEQMMKDGSEKKILEKYLDDADKYMEEDKYEK